MASADFTTGLVLFGGAARAVAQRAQGEAGGKRSECIVFLFEHMRFKTCYLFVRRHMKVFAAQMQF